jgi:hypothetical protein
LEVLCVARDDATDQVLRPRDAVRLEHLGHPVHDFDRFRQPSLRELDEDERSDRVAKRLGIDLGAVTGDDAAGLELSEPRLHGAARHPEPPGNLEQPDARVVAQRRYEARVELVEATRQSVQDSTRRTPFDEAFCHLSLDRVARSD